MEVFIGLELNPFEGNEVSSSCCVSMTVVFVDSMVTHQEIGLLKTTIKKSPTVSSSTKVYFLSLSLVLFILLLLSTDDFTSKHGRNFGLGFEDWEEYKQGIEISNSPHIFIDRLPASTSEEEVRDMLEKARKPTKVVLRPFSSHEGCKYAFVIYEDAPSTYTLPTIDNTEVEDERLAERIVESSDSEVRVFDVLA